MNMQEFLESALLAEPLANNLGLDSAELSALMGVATNKMMAGRNDEALKLYSILVLLDPHNHTSQLALANCALKAGEFELAMQCASSCIANEPSNPLGYFLSGSACMGMAHMKEAREDFSDAADLAKAAGNGEMYAEARRLMQQSEIH